MKNKLSKFILLSFLVFFLVLIFAERFGYYETRDERIKTLTDEQIKKFESDIEQGKEIDITEYVNYDTKDYSTNLSKGIYKLSLELEKDTDKLIKIIFNKTEKMVNE